MDSRVMFATLSHARVDSILELLSHFQLGASLLYNTLLQILGMLTATTSVIPLGLLHLRPFQRWNNSLQLNPARLLHWQIIFHCCIQALTLWNRREFLMSGVPLGVIPSRREVVTTDASLLGWGESWNHRGVCGNWSPAGSREQVPASHRQDTHLVSFIIEGRSPTSCSVKGSSAPFCKIWHQFGEAELDLFAINTLSPLVCENLDM